MRTICYYIAPCELVRLALFMRVGSSCFRGGVPMGISENAFAIRISRDVEITPRRWLYLGRLGGDRLPIGASALRREVFCGFLLPSRPGCRGRRIAIRTPRWAVFRVQAFRSYRYLLHVGSRHMRC